jgi:hypothetical protein
MTITFKGLRELFGQTIRAVLGHPRRVYYSDWFLPLTM